MSTRQKSYTLRVDELPWSGGAIYKPRPLALDALKRVQENLRRMIAQIEARERDAKVSNAISAMHSAYKPDGRPHTFIHPLLKD